MITGNQSEIAAHSLNDSSIVKNSPRKIERVNKQIENRNNKIFKKLDRAKDKLSKIDSNFSNTSNSIAIQSQKGFEVIGTNLNEQLTKFDLNNYNPSLDSLSTLLNYINKSNVTNMLPIQQLGTLQNEFQRLNGYKLSIFNYINIISNYNIKDEFGKGREKVEENLQKLTRRLDDLRVETEQLQNVSSIRGITSIPQIRQIYTSDDFFDFFNSNSFISKFFSRKNRSIGDVDLEKELVGLQTKEVLLADIRTRFGSHVNSVSELVRKDLPQSSSGLDQLSELKDRGNSVLEEKQQKAFSNQVQDKSTSKTKSEIGFTIQTSRPNILLPFTTDLGLSYGFAIGKKFITGAGASYRFSITNIFQNASFSSEGYSLRYFIHFKINKNFRITNEYDYGFLHNMPVVRQDQNIIQSNNQKRYTLGVMKSLPLKKKKYNIEVMYDLLHKSNPIQAQPFIFRTGFTF